MVNEFFHLMRLSDVLYIPLYETGKSMAELGCSKFFITRAVPPVYSEVAKANDNKEFF